MKNLFRFAMAVAVLFTASCAKEDISSSIGGGEVEVTFTANLADLGTRAIGDGTKANEVYLAIYEAGTNNALDKEIIDPTKPIDVVDKKASISVVLLKDKKYDLVFWAQNKDLDCFELNVENRYMEIDYTGAKSQVEKSDAFFLVRNNWQAGKDETIFELRRPFAQLNVGLSKNEVDKVTKNGVDVKQLWSKAVVKGVANVLDLGYAKPGTVSCSDDFNAKFKDGVTFNSAAKPTVALEVSDVKYEYLSMNYLLVEKTTIDVTYTFEEQGAEDTDYIRPYYNVPVQRNYRTNIVGNLLSSEYDFNVIIVPGFLGDNDTTVEYPEEGKLENLITPNLSKKSAQIILQSDVTWTTGAGIGSTPLIPEGEALKDLTIQGGEVSRAGEQPKITFKGAGVGAVRAANGGTITFRNVTIVDESESYAENSWEYGYLELGGKLVFENCTFVNAMMFEGTEATFTNCNFNSNKDSEYALWVSDGKVTVSKSTIEGPRGIKVHEAYGSEVASVAIDKCTFILTQKPALAIGDVNADTAISIKNSEISAQPGDQGLYIYETDTDVTTFNFTCENNTLVVNTYEALEKAVAIEGANILVKAGTYSKSDSVGLSASWAKNVTVTCEDGVLFKGQSKLNINGSTLIGGEFKNHKGNVAVDQTINGTFKKCNFNDTEAIRWAYAGETVIFDECIIGNSTCVRGVHFDGGANDVVFNNCTIYGFTALGGELTKITFNNCKFPENSNYNVVNMYSVFEYNNCQFNPQMHCDCAGNGVVADFNNCVYTNGSDIKSLVRFDKDQSTCVIRFNGKLLAGCKPPYTYDAATKTYGVATAEALVALSEVSIKGGETIKLEADIDLAGVDFTGINAFNPENNNTFDGQGHTIKNFVKQGAGDDYGFIRNWVGTIKNVTIEDANISGNGRIAILAAKPYGNIENCHIKNCTIKSTYWACGGLAGLYNAGSVKDCSAENVTVESNGGVGILIGVVNESTNARNFENCVVKNCNLIWSKAYGDAYGAGALVGMYNLDGTTTSLIKNCEVTGFKLNGVESDAIYGATNGTIVTVE